LQAQQLRARQLDRRSIVGKGMKIAQLQPGPAWNEAERRSIPIGIIGFFLIGLVAKFSDLADPFPLGLSGAVGFFLAALALMLGFYHRKAFAAQFVAGGMLVLPFALTALGVRLLPLTRGRSVIVLAGGLVAYLALHRWHRTLSKVESGTYLRQLAGDDSLVPKAGWQVTLYGIFVVIGAVMLLLILRAK
jgi:hypothetical protein